MLPVLLFAVSWALIAYTYIGFPALLALIARYAGTEDIKVKKSKEAMPLPSESSELPRVAMVVAAYNEAACLPIKLANTWAIDYPRDLFTLIVGSDGSSDQTSTVLDSCSDKRLQAHLFPNRRGKISVLNDLMEHVQADTGADIVVMSDANTMFAPNAVRKLVQAFQSDARVGCVSGELGLEQNGGVSGEGLYWKYEGFIKRKESKLGFLIGCNGGIFALRAEAYEPLPANTIIEDFVLTLRLLEKGWRVRFEPEARATEPPCPTSRAEMIRKIRIGAGNFQALTLTGKLLLPHYGLIAFSYWGHKVLRWLVSFFFIVALGANLLLAQQASSPTPRGFYRALLVFQIAGAVIAICSYNAKGSMPRWTRPISYFYLMNYALLCGFFRFLFNTQRVTWERASR